MEEVYNSIDDGKFDEKRLKDTFAKIKAELDEHLETINENSNEIDSNFQYILRLEKKIDKLNEKFEELLLIANPDKKAAYCRDLDEYKNIRLTLREQEVFMLLYATNDFLSYNDISKKLGFTPALIGDYITTIIEKGIPLLKKYSKKEPYVMLEPSFREIQAKEKVIDIDRRITSENNY